MEIKKIENEALKEAYYSVKHPSGLQIYVMPKENYSSAFAVFGTNYGSIDTGFKRSDENDFATIPEGTAHFLEHKLFESEELDAFERYAKTGASANAYTSFDQTCYLFSCSANFKENLEILIDFVQHPYFTQETVEKEQGIIGQEIRMYQDVPNWQVMFNLLRAMYSNHPVRIDIAGTIESIAEINADMLYRCYNTFYNLNNMALAVAGNVTVDEVIEVADRMLKKAENVTIERIDHKEPKEVAMDYIEEKLAVATPQFMLGFKETNKEPVVSLKQRLETAVMLDIIAGRTSALYNDMFKKGLINSEFGTEYFNGNGYAAILFSGETNHYKEVAELIKKEIKKFKAEGIKEEEFELVRRKTYGRSIMAFNDVDTLANSLVASHFLKSGLFDDIEILGRMTVEDVNNRLKNTLDENYSSLSVILPQDK
ncbi:MAG: insulinase family protein [Clostridiales bacterium]|nr:insulinase family protein [Clostridiales bacterium]